jgi:hypothetical protein
MDRRLLWVPSALLGAVTIVFTSFALLGVIAWAFLLIPLVRRGGLVALSGVLTGFGALWSFLILLKWTSSSLDTRAGWLVVGLVPLAIGLVLLAIGLVLLALEILSPAGRRARRT